ncbi:hypothetical protein [Flavobacterium sp. GSA192]|uniref:hypothetical protein n=1 Tax=Flavobacterium sp. GSA192 TaxID=2576304 RepID=UPI0011293239|nr:hypothetical protein [Flavobacterium sp. GSA192]
MIRNFDELLICIEKVEKEITKLKEQQRYFICNLNFSKSRQLFSKAQLLELNILNYINYYQNKIKDNYLENKLYKTKLRYLKIKHQPKSIANDLLYCIQELIIEYNELKKICNINELDDDFDFKKTRQYHFDKVELIYVELKNVILFSNSKINANQMIYYKSLTDYLRSYYDKRIKILNKELHCKTEELIRIQMEINVIKNELKLIAVKNKLYND